MEIKMLEEVDRLLAAVEVKGDSAVVLVKARNILANAYNQMKAEATNETNHTKSNN